MFSKKAMEDELSAFIETYLTSVSRLFRFSEYDGPPTFHPIFQICSSLYDYAFLGHEPGHPHYWLTADGLISTRTIDGTLADLEMFFLGIKSPNAYMRLYYYEDEVEIPYMAIKTIQATVARHVLYGGCRYTIPEDMESESGYLSFNEVALLADMDEKSVRNAANPKNKNHLITNTFGKRTLIDIDDAKIWLTNRRGFVPISEQLLAEKKSNFSKN